MTHILSLCALCRQPITADNDSSEHVLPNAIGGRLKVQGFICKSCNNTTGQSWDAELARQLNSLSNFFDVKRERGDPPPQKVMTTEQEKFSLGAGGRLSLQNPSVSQTPVENGTEIRISARDMKEAREILTGLKKKYPSINIEEMLLSAERQSVYPQGNVHLQLAVVGELSGRSIVKSCVAFAYHQNILPASCEIAVSYLANTDVSPCYGFYHETDLVVDRPNGVPIHVVAIRGKAANKLLIGYVEFFSIHRMVVCLSENYSGEDISASYAIDPVTGTPLELSVNLEFSSQDIQDIFEYKRAFGQGMTSAVAAVMPPTLQRHFDSERERVVSDAINYAFANCGAKEGDLLTDEHRQNIARIATERMMPFIAHIMRPR